MYLKEVEVNGFKSFANKISFKFNKGITAIVGPNGSGKSNVVDAIRWVLGEQKIKQLRGEKMEDVIFAGTEQRKSQGFAYVSITFDNSDHSLDVDFEEVKVSRKLYRSGESEYRLNDNICRLKDIHEIFYDTGIGKEGYSIIGQGQIDRILSGKPETRRELIDEAIGIVKFKKRKMEALRKLDNENINFLRLKDILNEMENQLNPLKIQAEKAKKYLESREELKKFEIIEYVENYKKIKKLLDKYEEDVAVVDNQLDDYRSKYEESKSKNTQFEIDLEFNKKNIDRLNYEIKDILTVMNDLSADDNLLNQEIKFKSRSLEEFNEQLENYNNTYITKQSELNIYTQQINDIDRHITENRIKLSEIDIEHNTLKTDLDNLNTSVEKYKGKLNILSGMEIEIAEKLSYSKAKQEYISNEQKILTEKVNELQSSIKTQEDKINSLNSLRGDVFSSIKVLNDTKSELNHKLLLIDGEIKKDEEEAVNLHRNFNAIKSKIEVLENLIVRYEGYGNAVKKLMEEYKSNTKNYGVVADILTVDSKYEVAIESTLGASLQNIVTEDTECAKKMISTLQKNKWGRVTFLPLNNLKTGKKIALNSIPDLSGIVGTASELVSFDKKFIRLIDYLLGNTLVVENIDIALSLNKSGFQSRIVTLDGNIIMPAGSISGGTYKHSSNLLSRNREIDELTEKRNKIEKDINAFEKRVISNRHEVNLINNRLFELDKDITIKSIELAKLEEKIEIEKLNLDSINNELAINSEKISITTSSDINKLQDDYINIKAEKNDLMQKISLIEEEISKKNRYFENVLSNVNDLRNNISSEQLKHDNINENIKRINKEIINISKEINNLNNKITESNFIIAKNENVISDNEDKYNSLKLEHEKMVSELKEFEENNNRLLIDNKKHYNEREMLNNEILELEKEKLRLQNLYNNTENNFNDKVSYMWDEYQLTYSEACKKAEYINLSDNTKLDENIRKLKNKIRSFGSINVDAVEEYRLLNERYIFHDKQLNDIIESKDNLVKIISSIDEGMIEQFNENYYKLEAELERVFKKLFGGGKVKMELVDSDNILESGININAQPPGKKLQNMLQLSGGEKALTAISLMFAIQNLNPSPFCFLDEIEAALDDNNVVRFSDYLSNLTENTQFIVITHRKGTMKAADRLYGVTMQEKGISTLVSVELV